MYCSVKTISYTAIELQGGPEKNRTNFNAL